MKSAKCICIPGTCHWVNGALKKKKKGSMFIHFPSLWLLYMPYKFPFRSQTQSHHERRKKIHCKEKKILDIIIQLQNNPIWILKSCMDNFSVSVVQSPFKFYTGAHRAFCGLSKILIRNNSVTKTVITCSKQKFFVKTCRASCKGMLAAVPTALSPWPSC